MKKKFLALIGAFAGVATLAACGGTNEPANNPGGNPSDNPSDNPTGGGGVEKTNIEIKVWAADKVTALTETQCNAWVETLPQTTKDQYTFTFNVQAQGEGDAASNMVTDVEAGADIFCFAQDQLAGLVQAGALAEIKGSVKTEITAANTAGSVAAATINDKLYAYPLTADNGYFMYYDKSVIGDTDLTDMTALLAKCNETGKKFGFQLTADGAWYNAAFFMGAGAMSSWTNTGSGFNAYTDTYNSAAGLKAAKGIYEITHSGAWVNLSSAHTGFASENGCAIVVSGTWDYADAKDLLGDNLGCAKLPKFTVGTEKIQLSSFSGYKLMGAKPQQDQVKGAFTQLLAQYLTAEAQQTARFNAVQWGPSNKVSLNNDAVKANPALVALGQQDEYATPQGQYPGNWWSTAAALGASIASATNNDDATLQAILQTYADALDALKG